MPVSPHSPPSSAAPPPIPPIPPIPPLAHRRSPSRWSHALLAAVVAVAALAAVAFGSLFMLSHGLIGLSSAPPRPPTTYAMSHGAPAPAQPPLGAAPGARTALSEGCASGSRTVWGNSLTVARSEHLCGNVDVYGGSATIDGSVQGNVTVVGGSAIVNGAVSGNVTAVGGSITLGANANVGGNVDALGGNVQKAPSATVGGNIEHGFTFHGVTPLSWLTSTGGFFLRGWSMLFWGLAAALAAIFFPRQLRNVRAVVRREPALSLGAGIATVVIGAVVALVLLITCIGIPVALVLGLGMWLAWVLGTVAIGLWIGEGLLRLGGSSDRSPVLASVLGVLLLALCEAIPCAGGILSLAAGFTGLGASALALLHSRQAAAMRARIS